jgi:holo-[acyl-carrier protein] synthase
MIIGIGTDLCDIRRIEKTLERFGDRFRNRVFTETEQLRAVSRQAKGNNGAAGTLAKRFAAKEACAKALGTGLSMGMHWRDMAVVNHRSGQPGLHLTGQAAERLASLMPAGHRPVIHLSMTDEYPYAQALVVIEALPIDREPQLP